MIFGNLLEIILRNNGTVPPMTLLLDKFRDFSPVEGIGATKYHLEEITGRIP